MSGDPFNYNGMSEEELCSRFVDAVEPKGWTCYPETGGFDLLLAANGDQIGVEAKRRPTFEVLYQALHPWPNMPGPDFHAVLVPRYSNSAFFSIARELRLLVFSLDRFEMQWCATVIGVPDWARWSHVKPVQLPDFVPDLPAGVPSPVRLTRWKVGALRLCNTLRDRGWLTLADFRAEGIDMGRWRGYWLIKTEEREGRCFKYVRNPDPNIELPDEAAPELAEQIRRQP